MDKNLKILIIMFIVALALFGLNTYIKKSNQIDYTNQEYIKLNNEEIPSIYKIIGNKQIIKTNTGIDSKGNYIELTYKELSINEVANYLSEFKEYNYALISSDETSAVIAGDSKESGKIITITATYKEDKTIIKYSKGNGTIKR